MKARMERSLIKTGRIPPALHSDASPEWGTPMLLRRFAACVLAPAARRKAIDLDYATSAYWQQWWDAADRPAAFLDGARGRDVLIEEDRRAAQPSCGTGFLNPPGLGSGKMVQRCWEIFEADHRARSFESGIFIGFSVEQFGSLQNVGLRNPLSTGTHDLITTIVPSRRVPYVVHPRQLIALTREKQKRYPRDGKRWASAQRVIQKLAARVDDSPVDAGAPSHLSYLTILWCADKTKRALQMKNAQRFLKEQRADPKSTFFKFEMAGSLGAALKQKG